MSGIDTIKILGSLLGSGSLSKGSGGNVLGSILGGVLGGGSQGGGGGGVADILGGLLGGGNTSNAAPQQKSGGGLGDLLGGLMGGQSQGSSGLGSVLGGLLGGGNSGGNNRQEQGGGIGDILGSVLGGGKGGLLTGLLGAAVSKYAMGKLTSDREQPSSRNLLPQGMDHNDASSQAELMIRAMINAAKSDGSIDKDEQEKILGKLGDISKEEAAFVRSEFQAPLDAQGFARSIPNGLEQQIYLISLMAIDLDTNKEATYLDQLARGLNISQSVSNQIHEKVGAPKLYS